MVALLRSEWTKLRSVRSTWWCTAVYAVVTGALGWLAAATTPAAADAGTAVAATFTGFGPGQIALVVLGVVAVTGDLGSGMALASLVAVPRRVRLLIAKTAVVTAWSALVTAVVGAVCALAARTLVAVPGGVQPTDPDVLRPLAVQVGAAALAAVLAVALGTVLRSTAGGVGFALALVLVLPPVLALSGGTLATRLAQALPALRVGEEAFLSVPTGWPVALAVTGAWVVLAWSLGAVLLERRDVPSSG